MTLTFAVSKVLHRIHRYGDPCVVFVCDGDIRLTNPGSRNFKLWTSDFPDGLIGTYTDSAKVLDLVADLSDFFTDDEVKA